MDSDRIEDDAVVVRGGRNRPDDIARGIALHPSGVTGISVHAEAGMTLSELADGIPHSQVGTTFVGEVRRLGGDVIRPQSVPRHIDRTGPDRVQPTADTNSVQPCSERPMTCPRVYADFQNADAQGRVRLNTRGTLDDLNRQQVTLIDGLRLIINSEDVEADAEVRFSSPEKVWTAIIDWDAVRQFDDVELPTALED